MLFEDVWNIGFGMMRLYLFMRELVENRCSRSLLVFWILRLEILIFIVVFIIKNMHLARLAVRL